jgi:hypothetical protein
MSIIITFTGTICVGIYNEKRKNFLFILLASSASSFQVGVYRIFDCVVSNISAFHFLLSMVVKKFSPEKDTYNMLLFKEEKAEP